MKLLIQEIDNEIEEYVNLHIHECNDSINTLISYIKNDKYKSIKLSCYKNGKIYKVKSDDIYFIETTKKQIKGKGKDLLFTIIYYYFLKKGSL